MVHSALPSKTWLIQQPYGCFISNRGLNRFDVFGGSSFDLVSYLATARDVGVAIAQSRRKFPDAPPVLIASDVEKLARYLTTNEYLSFDKSTQEAPSVEVLRLGENGLRFVRAEVELTRRCNQHCSYCYANAGERGAELSAASWSELLSELHSSGLRALVISGGEPFLHSGIWELLENVHDDLIIEINTNGSMISRPKAARLAQMSLKCVQVSLDSITESLHDGVRGAGTWRSARKAIDNLVHAGVPVRIATTIHQGNICETEGLKSLAADLGVEWHGNSLKRAGRAADLSGQLWGFEFRSESSDARSQQSIKPMAIHCESQLGYVGISAEGFLKPCNMPLEFFKSLNEDLPISLTDRTKLIGLGRRHKELFSVLDSPPGSEAHQSRRDNPDHDCVLRRVFPSLVATLQDF